MIKGEENITLPGMGNAAQEVWNRNPKIRKQLLCLRSKKLLRLKK